MTLVQWSRDAGGECGVPVRPGHQELQPASPAAQRPRRLPRTEDPSLPLQPVCKTG